ncbi:MAG: hypothetical protein QN131_12290 [Armatimonadota bacterium]|nr:hypothetical protein [Armatimonadota bacterium]
MSVPARPVPPEMRISFRAIAAYFAGVTLVAGRAGSSSPFSAAVLDSVLLVYLCGVVWAVADPKGRLRALKLLSVFNAVYYGIVGLLLLAMEARADVFHPERFGLLYRTSGDPIATLDRGLALAIAAQIALAVAFVIPGPARPTRSLRSSRLADVVAWAERPSVLVSVALAYIVSRVWPQHLPLAIAHVISAWGTLLEAVLAMRFVRWLRERDHGGAKARPWVWIAGVIGMVALYTGWRGRLVELPVLLVICTIADRDRVPLRWIALGSLAFGLFLIPWSIAYRSILWGGPDQGLTSRVAAAQAAFSRTAEMNPYERAVESLRFIAVRVGGQRIDELAGIAAQQTRLDGGSIWPFLAAPVPRALWPSKPQISPQLNVIARELGKGAPEDLQTSMVWTQYTDLVLNYGIIGLVIGALILGFLARWLNSAFLVTGRRTPATVGAFMLFFGPLWRENPVGLVYQLEVQFLLMLLVVLLFVRVPRTHVKKSSDGTVARA